MDTATKRLMHRNVCRPVYCLIMEDDTVIEIPDSGTFTIGRSEDCDLQRCGEKTSRVHCSIHKTALGEWMLSDMSMNGTFVNRDRVNNYALINSGDKISFSGGDFTFQSF